MRLRAPCSKLKGSRTRRTKNCDPPALPAYADGRPRRSITIVVRRLRRFLHRELPLELLPDLLLPAVKIPAQTASLRERISTLASLNVTSSRPLAGSHRTKLTLRRLSAMVIRPMWVSSGWVVQNLQAGGNTVSGCTDGARGAHRCCPSASARDTAGRSMTIRARPLVERPLGELWRNLGDDGLKKAAYRGG